MNNFMHDVFVFVTPINMKVFMYDVFAVKRREESMMDSVATTSVAAMCFGMVFSQDRSVCERIFWKQVMRMLQNSFTECSDTTSVKSVARLWFMPKRFGLRPVCLRRAGLMLLKIFNKTKLGRSCISMQSASVVVRLRGGRRSFPSGGLHCR